MFAERRFRIPSRVVFALLLFLCSVAAGEQFNRESCYQRVKSMVEDGTLGRNDTIFYRGDDGLPLSTPEHPVLTLKGCSEMCGTSFGWYKEIGPRLSTWLIPVFLLLMEVSPLDKQRYFMIVHLLGDPIDSLWSLLTKLEAWSQCRHSALKLYGSNDKRKVRNVATVLGGFEELVGHYNNPEEVFTTIKTQAKVEGKKFDYLISRSAQQLADSRTDERLRIMLAITLYIYQLISAVVTTISGGTTSPSGGRIGIAMFMTWIVPSILLSNAIGGFHSRRTCYDILESFVQDVTGHKDAWLVLQQAAPGLQRHPTVSDYLDSLAWSGAIYSYRHSKNIAFTSNRRNLTHRSLLFLLVTMPIVTSSIVASVILWNTPPIGIDCRIMLIFAITTLLFLSAFFTRVSTFCLKGSLHWHVVLAKDTLLAVTSVILIFLACAGLFNSCWCHSDVLSFGTKARVPLNTVAGFVAYNKTMYPILVGVCLTLQILGFMGMMWVGKEGLNVMRWSEEERKEDWKALRGSSSEMKMRRIFERAEWFIQSWLRPGIPAGYRQIPSDQNHEETVPHAWSYWHKFCARLAEALRRPPRHGYYRITWTCGCGQAMFADIKEIRFGAALALQSKLRQAAARVKQPQYGSSSPSRPPQAHLLPSYRTQMNLSELNISSEAPSATVVTGLRTDSTNIGSGAVINVPSIPPDSRYVLLCINTRRSRVLEHIDVTTVTTDEALFDLLRKRYSLAREAHKWQLSLLRLIIPFRKYILGYRADLSILEPKSADYVRFHLVPIKMEVCPSYLKRHTLPPESEVKRQNYHYSPCPPEIEEPLLQNQFMHELFKPGPHLDGYWTDSFPKKLKGQLKYIPGQRPVGWGIIINEGISWPVLWFGVLFTLVLTGIGVLACSMRTGDLSSAASLGAYFVAVLTLVVTLRYYKWQEQ